jgi:hypothetical protein
VDKLAGEHLDNPPIGCTLKKCPAAPPGYWVCLQFDNSVISSKYYTTSSQLKPDAILKSHILKKTKWTLRIFDTINWSAHHQAFRRLTRHQQISISKLIHGLANTNRQNFLYYKTSLLYPICQQKDETFEHVVTCLYAGAKDHRDSQLLQLEKSLQSIHTPQMVTKTILQGFQHWIEGGTSHSRAPAFGSLLQSRGSPYLCLPWAILHIGLVPM